jgi:hypothetical protein
VEFENRAAVDFASSVPAAVAGGAPEVPQRSPLLSWTSEP